MVSEQKFERYCYDNKCFEDAGRLWRTEVVMPRLILSSTRFPGKLFFSVYPAAPMVVMWEVSSFDVGPTRFYRFEKPRKDLPSYHVIRDFKEWDVHPWVPASPLDLYAANNKGKVFKQCPDAFGVSTGPVKPVLTYLAENGFLELPETYCNRLMKHEFGKSPDGEFITKLAWLAR